MKISYRKIIAIGIVGLGLVAGVWLALNPNFVKPAEASISPAPVIQVKPDTIVRDGWNLTITEVTFGSGQSDLATQGASVNLTITNNDGRGKAFLPKGKIIGVIGSSGKLYEVNFLKPLNEIYTKGQTIVKKVAQEEGKTYEPGVLKMGFNLTVDASEKTFTKIVYQDEKENNVEIPVQITPKIIAVSNGH